VQALLRTMPFAVPFETRATLFEAARQAEHARCQRGLPQVPITVRRDMLFESAYGALAGVRGDAMRRKVAVTFINAEGVPESGLDAGGLFKELLTELCKLVFDEAYGLFKANAQGELYPNPASHLCTGTPDAQSFEFVGRLVGKALFEGITIGPQFARFFLHKLLGRPLNLHYLPSLDPELYRSLMFLKGYEGDVGDLALTFTVTPELGEGIPTAGGASGAGGGAGGGSGAVTDTGEVELVPGGRGIAVTAANRLSYIYAIANWRLSTSIQRQCDAFLRGMRDVLPASWLAPFSAPELQVLLSGSQRGVDVADLQAHTEYVGGFWVHDSTIRAFWSVVADFSERDRAALLKFVTAAERAPPNGFQQLQPPFTIAKLDMRGRPGGADELLPMASTCFNVLKLPPYSDKKTLRRQLLTAIHSGAGFELT
jgi:ubiquitin-protein ligase E3 C